MKVSQQDVAYVAELANLDLSEHERAGLLRDLNSVLDYIDLLSELDTSNVPAMAQVSVLERPPEVRAENGRWADGSREDVPDGLRPSLPHRAALENTPDTDGTFFRVPKVIER